METWDVSSLEIEPHHPQVLRSDDETRAIAIQLPAGEQLQSHQVHERTYMIVVAGEVKISQDGERRPADPDCFRISSRTSAARSKRSATPGWCWCSRRGPARDIRRGRRRSGGPGQAVAVVG